MSELNKRINNLARTLLNLRDKNGSFCFNQALDMISNVPEDKAE